MTIEEKSENSFFDGMDTAVGRLLLGVFFEGTKLEYVISHPVTWSFLVNIPLTSVFFLSTRIFYRHWDTKREARVERFFVDLHLPVDFE